MSWPAAVTVKRSPPGSETFRRAAGAALLLLAATVPSGCGGGPASLGPAPFDPDTLPEAYARSMAALMAPGATRSFLVTERGEFENGVWRVLLDPSSAGERAQVPRVVAYEQRWLPIAHWRLRSGGVTWEFEAVALADAPPADTVLMVSLRVRATNAGATSAPARLVARLEPAGPGSRYLAPDAPRPPAPGPRWAADDRERALVVAWSERAPGTDGLLANWKLAPGDSRETRLVLSAYPRPAAELRRWARVSHTRLAARARAEWSGVLERGTRFALGDPEVEDAIRAALVVLLANRVRAAGEWIPVGGPFHYRDLWLRDGARAVAALAVAGHGRVSRELASGLALCQWPQGAFLSQRGQLDGCGQAMWAFAQAGLRPAPDSSASRFATLARSAWKWVEWQREQGRESGWPYGRMLPFVDPRDNELVNAQLVGNDAWAIAGYESAARLLRAAGRAPEAHEVEASRLAYVRDFRDALDRSGSADLPPSWQGGGRDWGNLTVSWPCRALPADDPRCLALAARVWRAAGGPSLATYGSADSLHAYLGADLGTWSLLAGRPGAADSILADMLRWRSASGGAAEIFSRSTRDFAGNLPPHPTAAAALVMLVRNMLVHDDDDTLRLTLGARPGWWRGGRLERAPTRWGDLMLEFELRDLRAHWRWTAVPVWTSLTLAPGTRLADAPPAPLLGERGGRVVLAPPGTREASVVTVADVRGRP